MSREGGKERGKEGGRKVARELPADVEPLLEPDAPVEPEGPPDPIREQVARDLESNVLLQYAFSKASRLSRGGQLEEAAAEYAKLAGATAQKPALKGLALVLRAEMLLRDPPTVLDVAGARAALEQAQQLDAPVREWTFTLGMLALREDRLQDAVELLTRSFTSGHQPQEAAAYLAAATARLGDREAGRQWLELARENGPVWRSPEAEIALRHPDDPILALQEAAAEHPDEFWLRLALAPELTAAGRHSELIALTSTMATDSEVPERFRAVAALGAARSLLLHGSDERVPEAMRLAAQARSLAPKALAVWDVLALGYCRQRQFRRAAAAAKRVGRAEPGSATSAYVSAWAMAAQGRKRDRVAGLLAAAVERDPSWPLRARVEAVVAELR
jgi:tetratricopeptide (TPR) repeat protein